MNWFIFAMLSAVLTAASTVLEKKALFKMESLDFAFWIAVLNVLFALPFFFMLDINSLKAMNLFILFIKSALGAAAFLCIMTALKNMEINKSLPLMVLSPGLVALFAYLFLGDALMPLQIAGLVLLLAGTYLLEMKPKQALHEPFLIFSHSKYHHYIGAALALFTISSILDKLLLGQYKMPPMTFMAFQQLFYMVVIGAVFLFSKLKTGAKVSAVPRDLWIILLGIAVFTLGYRYSQILATKRGPVGAVLAVKRISVFIAAVWGGKLFNESNRRQRALATAIMVVGALLIMED